MKRTNLRRWRSEAMSRAICNALRPYIDPADAAGALYALRDLFEENGVEIITDAMREELGLPPRGPDGWTADEIEAWDRRFLEHLTRPLVSTLIVPADNIRSSA